MKTVFSDSYTREYPLQNLSEEHFLVLANETVIKFDWKVPSISRAGLLVYPEPSEGVTLCKIRVTLNESKAVFLCELSGDFSIQSGIAQKYVNDFIQEIENSKQVYSSEKLDEMYYSLEQSYTGFDHHSDGLWVNEPDSAQGNVKKVPFIKALSTVLIPKQGYVVTPILIHLNITVFILMALSGANILSPDGSIMVQWGANFRPLTLSGEPWRLITCCFLHFGILHLLMNLYALVYIGALSEGILGKAQFLSAYLLGGIASSTVSLWWHLDSVSAGASGAIFCMFGVFLALLSTDLIDKSTQKKVFYNLLLLVGLNFLLGLKAGIDNAAHFGGFVSGVIIGYAYVPGMRESAEKNDKYAAMGILSVVVLLFSIIMYKGLPNDFPKYEKAMNAFVDFEQNGLSFYRLSDYSSKELLLLNLDQASIPAWQRAKEVLDGTDTLEISEALHNNADALKEYCDIRIKTLNLIRQKIDEETTKYDSQIKEYHNQLEKLFTAYKKRNNK